MGKKSEKSGFYLGSVTFSGLGGFQEEFVSDLLENGVYLRNTRFSGGKMSGEVSPLEYYKTSRLARKNGVRLRAGRRRGLYFTLSRYRSRVGLYFGALVFVFLLSIFQSQVRVISCYGDASAAEIEPVLYENGVFIGKKISELDCSLLEQKLLLGVNDCAWADVSCEGFRLKVEVHKSVKKPEMETSEPRDLVASRDAVIISQTVRKGASVLMNGSGAAKGDILVSGLVDDGGGNILKVHADGEIIGEFRETAEFFVPLRETVSEPSGKQHKFKYLIFRDDVYPLFFSKAGAENSLYSEEIRPILGGNMKIKTEIYTEYVSREIERTPEKCVEKLKKQMKSFEENFFGDYEMISSDPQYYPQSDGVKLVVEYVLRGNIAQPAEIRSGIAN